MSSEPKLMSGVAYFENGRIIVKDRDCRSFLIQKGYGVKEDGLLVLNGEEALYLISENRLRLFEGEHELDLEEATRRLLSKDPDVWIRFLVYRSLRDRGYVVRRGYGPGLGFLLYERGTYGKQTAKYMVAGISEGSPIRIEELLKDLESAIGLGKELLLAVVDRRGEVVYYKVSRGFGEKPKVAV